MKPPLCEWVHDPSGQPLDYSILLPILAADTLVSATVEALDANGAPLVDDSLTIDRVSFALVNEKWFLTLWVFGGTSGAVYRLRVRWTLSDGRGSDWIVRLQCLNNN